MVTPTERRGPGRPPAGTGDSTSTHDLILQHAERLFQERGYVAVAMGDIAAAVGVTKPTLYYHFPHKEALYTAMGIGIFGRIGSHIERVLAQYGDLEEQLYWLAFAGLAFAPRRGNMGSLMRDGEVHLADEDRARLRAAMDRQMMDPLRAVMRVGLETGRLRTHDVEFLTQVWFTLLDAAIQGKIGGEPADGDPAVLARNLTDLFLRGAAPPESTHPAMTGETSTEVV